jgi:hypothetical protein
MVTVDAKRRWMIIYWRVNNFHREPHSDPPCYANSMYLIVLNALYTVSEIPLFHVLNARITFGNIFAMDAAVAHVEYIQEGSRLACVIDDACFGIGRAYRDAAAPADRLACLQDDDGLLQYAIQQSLMEAGTSDDQVPHPAVLPRQSYGGTGDLNFTIETSFVKIILCTVNSTLRYTLVVIY